MEQTSAIQLIFGSITSILLSVVAYFIKQLHSDFRKMELDLSEVKTTTMLIKTEFKSRYDLLCQRVEYLEKRDQIHFLGRMLFSTHKNKLLVNFISNFQTFFYL